MEFKAGGLQRNHLNEILSLHALWRFIIISLTPHFLWDGLFLNKVFALAPWHSLYAKCPLQTGKPDLEKKGGLHK